MATSMFNAKAMKEENPNSCRALITTREDPTTFASKFRLSYFISIAIPQPKIRIKLPKLLVKTMRRRNHKDNISTTDNSSGGHSNDKKKKKKKKWAKPGDVIPRKVRAIIRNIALRNKRSSSRCGDDMVHSNGDDLKECMEERESKKLEEVKVEESVSEENENGSSENSLNWQQQDISETEDNDDGSGTSKALPIIMAGSNVAVPVAEAVKCVATVESPNCANRNRGGSKPEDDGKREKTDDHKRLQQKTIEDKQVPPLKLSLPFSGFFSKSVHKASSYSNSSSNLARVPSRGFRSSRKIRSRARLIRKELMKQEEEEEEERGKEERESEELCKKRILMGEKCRPLNVSGALHYDKNGILLPEEILPCEESSCKFQN